MSDLACEGLLRLRSVSATRLYSGAPPSRNFPLRFLKRNFNPARTWCPSFDGWLRNADGTFTFVFGYMNRNYKEELVIPAGPDNKVEPGTALDQGQPTYFLPRRHAWVFRVTVPADWGQKELVWTITAHGKTEKAYASLQMEEEIIAAPDHDAWRI